MSAVKTFREPVVYVVDDNSQSSRATAELVQTFGPQVKLFESQVELLEAVDSSSPGCILLDLLLPGSEGAEVQQQLMKQGVSVPTIFLADLADTSLTVRSLRNGAFTVLEKPFRDDDLWSSIQEALEHSKSEYKRQLHISSLERRLKKLAPQDRAVLQLMLQGMKNRSIAKRLDVSLRTVENRRRRVFDVMQVDSVALLTRMVVEYEHNLPPSTDSQDIWLSLPFEKVAC